MSQVVLNVAYILTFIGQLVATSMTEHVRMYAKVEAGCKTGASKHLAKRPFLANTDVRESSQNRRQVSEQNWR
jgi:hypothetical protein